jgi:hypothetical protein
MKKTSFVLSLVILAAVPAIEASAATLLVVGIQESNGEKSTHYQKVPDCLFLLKKYRQATKEGVAFNLTLVAPDVTGRVFSFTCIHPDGSSEGDFARPAKP